MAEWKVFDLNHRKGINPSVLDPEAITHRAPGFADPVLDGHNCVQIDDLGARNQAVTDQEHAVVLRFDCHPKQPLFVKAIASTSGLKLRRLAPAKEEERIQERLRIGPMYEIPYPTPDDFVGNGAIPVVFHCEGVPGPANCQQPTIRINRVGCFQSQLSDSVGCAQILLIWLVAA